MKQSSKQAQEKNFRNSYSLKQLLQYSILTSHSVIANAFILSPETVLRMLSRAAWISQRLLWPNDQFYYFL